MTPSITFPVRPQLPSLGAMARRWLRFDRQAASALQQAHAQPSRTELALHATLWLDGVAGTTVVCDSGCLWLTVDGEQRDVILEAGQTFCCDRRDGGARIAVHALAAAQVRVGSPA